MTAYIAIFPIHAPAPDARLHRQALNQLPSIVPNTVTITGPWEGHTWTDPDGRHWWVMTAPAEGTDTPEAIALIRQTAHHIHPTLEAWTHPGTTPAPVAVKAPSKRAATRPRLEDLEHLVHAGTAVEDATRRCGWNTVAAAARAAYRANRITLARTLEAVA